MKAEQVSRTHHLPKAQLAAVLDRLRDRGLVDSAGSFTDAGRETRQRIEALTGELAAPAYDVLTTDELDELVVGFVSSSGIMLRSGRAGSHGRAAR
jgi:hypothetical protein